MDHPHQASGMRTRDRGWTQAALRVEGYSNTPDDHPQAGTSQ